MAWKDKYDDYKEREEAKRYFRSQNDQFLNTNQWIKLIISGILAAIAIGVILGIVISLIHITSMLFYLVAAYLISNVVTKVSGIRSQQMGIIAAVFAVLTFIVVNMTLICYPFMSSASFIFEPLMIFQLAIKMFFDGNIFTTIVALISVFIAYQQAQ